MQAVVMFGWPRPVSFVNASVVMPDGIAASIRFASRILSIDERPSKGDLVADLAGAFVYPGLVNAHDHLELNHYGRMKLRPQYDNACDWIDDLTPELKDDPDIRRNTSYPLKWRLFAGGLKNVLSGVTTVAHHNPRYQEIAGGFPVRIVKRYRWAHSFHLEGKPVGARGERGKSVTRESLAAPLSQPFMVHLGEGVDDRAARELPALESCGALRENTLLVHGVAIGVSGWRRVLDQGASLAWCPASNVFLFGRTVPARQFLDARADALDHMCVATDSRLTGANDLLDELRVARSAGCATPAELLRMVTASPARALKLRAGRIAVDGPADLMVLPALEETAADTLLAASRRHVALVVVGGQPVVGTRGMRPVFAARCVQTGALVVDGAERLADVRLARAIARSPIPERGVACP